MLKILFKSFAALMALPAASCLIKEPIPVQTPEPVKDAKRIQKSVSYGDSTIFLQCRESGIKTNDLIIGSKDGSLRYLCQNRYFISDFCISKRGILYFSEAGMDYGYEVGTRGRDFHLRQIDLKDGSGKVETILPSETFTEPQRLELSHNGKLLCFAGHFGEIHVIDLATRREMGIDLHGVDPNNVQGLYLSVDRKSFRALVKTEQSESGSFIWNTREFPLPFR